MKQRISSNGGPGRRGFQSAGGVASSNYLFERIWIPAQSLAAHPSNPPNGPYVKSFPSTIQAYIWEFSATELDLAFAWFALPSRYWKYQLTAPTECTLRFYWCVDTTVAQTVCWRGELNYVRHGETINFAPPALQVLDKTPLDQYGMRASTHTDFPINNPSGSVAETEGAFYLKFGRDGTAAGDTYTQGAFLIGISVEFPLKFP